MSRLNSEISSPKLIENLKWITPEEIQKELSPIIFNNEAKIVLQNFAPSANLYHKAISPAQGLYFATPKDSNTIEYLYYDPVDIEYLPIPAKQCIVWRDFNSSVQTQNIPMELFFKILLPKTKAVVTDCKQTEYGKNFWKRAIANAFRYGKYHIYHADLASPLHSRFTELKSEREFDKANPKIWGSANVFEKQLVIISEKFIQGAFGLDSVEQPKGQLLLPELIKFIRNKGE